MSSCFTLKMEIGVHDLSTDPTCFLLVTVTWTWRGLWRWRLGTRLRLACVWLQNTNTRLFSRCQMRSKGQCFQPRIDEWQTNKLKKKSNLPQLASECTNHLLTGSCFYQSILMNFDSTRSKTHKLNWLRTKLLYKKSVMIILSLCGSEFCFGHSLA